jgi:anti-sigma B factor antagonist
MHSRPLIHTARGPVEVVEAPEELDVYSAADLRQLLASLVNDHGRYLIVVDLGRTVYMDSTGLGVLIGGLRRARAHGGRLAVADLRESIRKMIEITGLTAVLRVAGTVDEAADAMLEDADAGAGHG